MTNTKFGEIQMLFEKAEELGWSIEHEDGNVYRFGQFSNEGQDFGFSVDTEGEPTYFLDNIYEQYSYFDVSEETYLWLDNTGHGKNGAPYDMKDVYEDMEQCKDMMLELHNELKDYYYKEIYRES